MNWLSKLVHKFDPIVNYGIEEHRIVLPGLDIAFNHTTKTVFVIDQTGSEDNFAMAELVQWFKEQGYHLHGVSVTPEPIKTESPDGSI